MRGYPESLPTDTSYSLGINWQVPWPSEEIRVNAFERSPSSPTMSPEPRRRDGGSQRARLRYYRLTDDQGPTAALPTDGQYIPAKYGGFLLDLERRRRGTRRSLLLRDGEERGARVIWLNDPEHPLSAWLICLHGWTHNIWIIRKGRRPERENYSSLRPWYVDKNNSNNWHYSSNIIWSHCENCEERRRIDNGIMHVVQSRVAKMFCWMSNANWLYV